MAKKYKGNSEKDEELVGEFDHLFDKKSVVEEKPAPDTIKSDVKLQSLMDARLHYDGEVSGRHYVWERAGSILFVDAEDAPYLLSKKSKSKTCCSGNESGAIFQELD